MHHHFLDALAGGERPGREQQRIAGFGGGGVTAFWRTSRAFYAFGLPQYITNSGKYTTSILPPEGRAPCRQNPLSSRALAASSRENPDMAASDYEVLDERFRNCVNRTSHVRAAVDRRALDRRAGVLPGRAATCCSPTSRTTASCATTRPTARSRCSARRAATPTATPSTGRAGSSRASTAGGASRAPSTTAASR